MSRMQMFSKIKSLFVKKQEVHLVQTNPEDTPLDNEQEQHPQAHEKLDKQDRLILRVLNEMEPTDFEIEPDMKAKGFSCFYTLKYGESISLRANEQRHFGWTGATARLEIDGCSDAFTTKTTIGQMVRDKAHAMMEHRIETKHYKIEDILEKKQ